MKKLIKNAIKCKLCGDVIESTDRHEMVSCKCGACSVDGEHEYQKIIAKDMKNVINLSKYKETK